MDKEEGETLASVKIIHRMGLLQKELLPQDKILED
jgi:hypothetical protein